MPAETSIIRIPELTGSRPDTSHEYAYRRLRNALMIGAIAPGISITIQDLASELDVSATPVREALRQLSSENALFMAKNRRIRVPEMTQSRFRELIELRCTLEIYAARRAFPYINLVLIDEIERIDAEIDDMADKDDWGSMVMLNQQMHTLIYQANPQQTVMPMIESLWLQLGPIMGVAARHQRQIYKVDYHRKIIDALRAGDEARLGEALEADIRDGSGVEATEILSQLVA